MAPAESKMADGLVPSYEARASNPARSGVAARGSQPYSYIERCFRWAYEADRQALLFYNEAEAEVVNPKSDAIYAMVRDFRQRGVPIDGVGFQMHIANLNADAASMAANIDRFTALGVQVHIHGDGRRPARRCRRQCPRREPATAGRHLSPDCQRWSVASEVNADPDLELHRQVFLDRLALEENTRRGAAV